MNRSTFRYKKFTDGLNVYFVGNGPENNGNPAAKNYQVYYYALAHPGTIVRYNGFRNFFTTKQEAYAGNLLWYAAINNWQQFDYGLFD